MGETGHRATRGFTLIELMIVVAIIGILAAIAVPNFLKFQARSRQSEAKLNLKGVFGATKAYFSENASYLCGFCGWTPESDGVTKYHYYAGSGATHTTGSNGCTEAEGGTPASGQADPNPVAGTHGAFTATASGNIDGDSTCDGWSINDHNDLINNQSDVDL